MVSWLFCFLCFTSSVSLTGFYTEDGPNLACWWEVGEGETYFSVVLRYALELPFYLRTHRRFVVLSTSRLAVANKDDDGSLSLDMTKYRVETHSVLHVHNIDLKNLPQPQAFAHDNAMFTPTQIRHFCSLRETQSKSSLSAFKNSCC